MAEAQSGGDDGQGQAPEDDLTNRPQSYELGGTPWVAVVLGAVAIVGSLACVILAWPVGLVGLLLTLRWAALLDSGLRGFYRVTLDQEGVSFDALARQIRIPWDDLASVAPPRRDARRRSYRWSRRNGESVAVSRAFPNIHRMLAEVERRAPHVSVTS